MTIKPPHCINKNYLLWLFISLFLTACLGGGSGSDGSPEPVQGASLGLLPANSNASGSLVLTALIKDQNNVPLADQSIEFSFSQTNAETLSPQTAQTGADGTATVTITDVGKDGGTVTVQARSGNLTATAQVNFINNADTQNLQVTPSTTVLSVGDTALIYVRLSDEQGVPQEGQTVHFASSGQAFLDRNNGTTDSDGRLQVSLSNQVAETVQLEVSHGALRQTLRLDFGASLSFLPSNARGVADGTTAVPLIARLLNAQGQAIVGETVQFFSLQGNAELEFFSGQTADNGQVTLNVRNRTVETSVIGAQVGTLARQEVQVVFETSAVISNLQVTPSATVLRANDTATIDILLQDAQGIPNANQNISVSRVSGTASLSASEQVTDSAGRAQVTLSSGTGNVQLEIRAGTLSHQVTFYFAAQLSLLPKDSIGSADGNSAVLLTARLLDAEGRGIVGQTLQFFSISGNAELEFFSKPTAVNGQVDLNVRNRSVETSVIGVQVGTLARQEVPIDFQSPAPVTDKPVGAIGIAADKTLLNVGSDTEVRIILSDAIRSSVAVENGVSRIVTVGGDTLLPFTPFNASVSGSARLLNLPTQTDANAQASFQLIDNQAENVTLTITSGGKNQTKKFYFGARLSLTPQQQTVKLSASPQANLFAVLRDANNTLISGEVIRFGFVGDGDFIVTPAEHVTGTGSFIDASDSNNTNDAQRTSTAIPVTVDNIGEQSGSVTITANGGDLNTTATVTFESVLDGNKLFQATVDQRILQVGDTAKVQARILEASGLPTAGFPISFWQNGQLLMTQATDNEGNATVSITQNQPGNTQVEVRAGNHSQRFTLYFGARLRLSPDRAQTRADTQTPALFTAHLVDFENAPVVAETVHFNLKDGSAFFDLAFQQTDAAGLAQVKVTGSQIGEASFIAQSGAIEANEARVTFLDANIPARISLLAASPSPLSVGGNNDIIARVVDALGNPLPNIEVRFSTAGVGSITEAVNTDVRGEARAVFSSTRAGSSTLTATVIGADHQPVSDSINLIVQAGGVGVIEVVSIEPAIIGIRGGGMTETATVTVSVKDALGNLLDGQNVGFSLGGTLLSGGETLSANATNTVNGLARVVLRSGNVVGTVDVVASVANANISTVAAIQIVGGMPDAAHFSLAAEYLNIAGGTTFGLQNKITAFVADRFANVVQDGTRVNFISEGGSIGLSPNSATGAFEHTTAFGQATAILQSAAPNSNLGGIAPESNAGLVNIVAYTIGSESYRDNNANGVFDAGDELTHDMSEPYIDANDSGAFEVGEVYVDVNNNGMFDPADGVFQNNRVIWTAINVLFSAATNTDRNILKIEPHSNTAMNCAALRLTGVHDVVGNPLVSGTKIDITATQGQITGTESIQLNDQINPPTSDIQFGLQFDNATTPTVQSTVTVVITSPPTTSAPGGNGSIELSQNFTCTP